MTTRTKKDLDIPAAELIMHRHWCWLLGFGVLLMILGCIGLGMVVSLTLASMFFFAALLFISGISHFADAFQNRHWKGGLWEVFIGLLYLIAAALIL